VLAIVDTGPLSAMMDTGDAGRAAFKLLPE
jgi:hypothetical protein